MNSHEYSGGPPPDTSENLMSSQITQIYNPNSEYLDQMNM